jgi:hypothetical protein
MFFRRHRRTLARALGALACVSLTTTALGAGMPPGASAGPDDRLQRLLEYNPGSVRITPDTIRTKDGVEISLPTLSSKAKAAKTRQSKVELAAIASADRCSSEDLCLFQNQMYEGEKLTIPADCLMRGLWTYKLSNGQTWDLHVDSYINNNPKVGTWATLFRVWGSKDVADMDYWDIVESHRSAGPAAPSNAIGGMPWANRTAAVRVCQP